MLRFLARLFGFNHPSSPEPERARPLPAGLQRLHLFCGNFDSEPVARAYVLEPETTAIADAPTPMTVDLPDAYIDPNEVSLGFGADLEPLLQRFFEGEALLDVNHLTIGADTVVIVREAAMGGFPFRLTDTPPLRYLGAFERPL